MIVRMSENQFMENVYCNECHEPLLLHADGSIYCSCSGIEPGSDQPKAWWPCSADDIKTWRTTEQDYAEQQ